MKCIGLRGKLSAPEVDVICVIPTARIDSIDIADLYAEAHFEAGDLTLRQFHATVSGGQLDIAGQIGADQEALPEGGQVALRVAANDIDVGILRHWSLVFRQRITHLSGRLSAALQTGGTRSQPAVSGSLAVSDGGIEFTGLEQRFSFDRASARMWQDSLIVTGLRDRGGACEVCLRPTWGGRCA